MEKMDEIRNSFRKINVETANDILNAGAVIYFFEDLSFFNRTVYSLLDSNFILQCKNF